MRMPGGHPHRRSAAYRRGGAASVAHSRQRPWAHGRADGQIVHCSHGRSYRRATGPSVRLLPCWRKPIEPWMSGMHEGERVGEPSALRCGEDRQCRYQVQLVLRPRRRRLVEQLHLGDEMGNAVRGEVSQRCDRTPDTGIAPAFPLTAPDLLQHHLDPPRPIRPGSTPDVVHPERQQFSWPPPAQHPGRVRGPPFPTGQDPLYGQLIATKDRDIDVVVCTKAPPDRTSDRVSTRDPPRPGQIREQRGRLARLGGRPPPVPAVGHHPPIITHFHTFHPRHPISHRSHRRRGVPIPGSDVRDGHRERKRCHNRYLNRITSQDRITVCAARYGPR